METIEDRIRLCEAMGWEFHTGAIDARYWCLSSPERGFPDKFHSNWQKAPGQDWKCADCYDDCVPNPFTDANDDYAVLEWMRSDDAPCSMPAFVSACNDIMRDDGWRNDFIANYKIGDYARAALKVIDN